MRDDLVVPGEHEENFVLAKDARVVTVPFTPLEQRMAKEKPYLMEGLAKLKEILGEDNFKRLISNVHNINLSGPRIMLVADNELHRTNIERECLPAIAEAFNVTNIRVKKASLTTGKLFILKILKIPLTNYLLFYIIFTLQ